MAVPMTTGVELLTAGDDGHAVEGACYPGDGPSVVNYLEPDDLGIVDWFMPGASASRDELPRQRLAYQATFFARTPDGDPIPDTEVDYYVPADLMDGATPSATALWLVAEREQWNRRLIPGWPRWS